MPIEIYIATFLFTLALVFYSIAIWSDRIAKQLKRWHVIVFFLGVVADIVGVWITIKVVGAIVFTPHAILGFIAVILIILHFLWVLFVFLRNKPRSQYFHQFGLVVWTIWILSYLSGLITGIQKMI